MVRTKSSKPVGGQFPLRNGLPITNNSHNPNSNWIADRANAGAGTIPNTFAAPVLGRSITNHLRLSQEKFPPPKPYGTPGTRLATKKQSLTKNITPMY